MSNPGTVRPNPELLLKLTHLRGAISELMLRNRPRLQALRQGGGDPVLVEDLMRWHQELASKISEFEIVLDSLRRRGEEAEQVAQDELGSGRLQIEADRFDITDLETLVTALRRCYDAILFAKAPLLPLDKLYRLEDFRLLVHLTRQDGVLNLHLKSPLVESYFVPALQQVARAIGIGEKPVSGSKVVPLGWGPALIQVQRLAQRSLARAESHQDRLQESLDSIRTQFDDQLNSLADPASLGLPVGCLRTVAELLADLVLDLREHGHVRVLRLGSPYDEIYLLDEAGREPRGPDGKPQRDPVREKMDRFVTIPKKES